MEEIIRAARRGSTAINVSGRLSKLKAASKALATGRWVEYMYNEPITKSMVRLVSIPLMAKVTDIGDSAQRMAVAMPALGKPIRVASFKRSRHVKPSARALKLRANSEKGAWLLPKKNAMSESSIANRGVVVPRTASPGLYTSPLPLRRFWL
jgi:hypothetical protein